MKESSKQYINLIFLCSALIGLSVISSYASGQTKGIPEPQSGVQDYSCMKYEIQSLRDAAAATDQTTAELDLSHADAYHRLTGLSQPC